MKMKSDIMNEPAMEMKVGVDKFSNNLIYGTSLFSILVSLLLLKKNPVLSIFTGLWVPSIIGLGIFMKENRLMELEKRHA